MKLTSKDIVIFSECISFTENKSAIFNVDIYLSINGHRSKEKIGHMNIVLNLTNNAFSAEYDLSGPNVDYNEISNFIANKCFERCKTLMA